MNEIEQYQPHATAVEIRKNINLIQEVMASVMKKDVHFGTIPGTPKPTLYKAGAEKVLATFKIGVEVSKIEDLSTPDSIRYRVILKAVHQPTGTFIGEGVGECSSDEEKYKWKRPVCEKEFENTPETHRRIKYQRNYRTKKIDEIQQIRTQPADLANTILKMAKKRSLIDLTLTATAASDVFDQDIEEIHEIMDLDTGEVTETIQKPKRKDTISDKQAKLMFSKCDSAGVDKGELKKYLESKYNIESSTDIKKDDFDDILEWIDQNGKD